MDKLIQKSIIYKGDHKSDFQDGTKVTFHVKVETPDKEVVDDSRSSGEPVELILGKKFKLEVWEICVKTMMVGEVAKFLVDKKLLTPYPVVSKTLRDHLAKKAGKNVQTKSHHCCGIGLKEGLGYPDLDDLVTNPKDLHFTIELLKVEEAGAYQKEFWAMTEEEQRISVPVLREEGNTLYKAGNYTEASKKYAEAIARLENLMLREKPNDVEWKELNNQKLPLLLNYSQCQLLLEEYYPAIEHCSEVLMHEPDNVKALFRRGKAYVKVFSAREAEEDLKKVVELDPTLEKGVEKLLRELSVARREKLLEDKKAFQKLFI